jgi:hypothetical protein
MDILTWMSSSGLGTWVRESPSLLAYPFILTLHSVGLAFLVGINVVIDLRILGFARRLPLGPTERFLPIFWIAFWLNALTGVALLFGGALTLGLNPVFYLKLFCIVLAMATMRMIRRGMAGGGPEFTEGMFPLSGKTLAAASLFFWMMAITSGRLTAYIGNPLAIY